MLNGPRVALWKKTRHEVISRLALAVVGSADANIAIIHGDPAPSAPPNPAHLPLYRDHRRILAAMEELQRPPHEPSDPAATEFLVRFALRCAHTCLRTPGNLIRAARNGNLEALEQLFRLDKAAILEPRVALHLAAIFHSGPPALKTRMADALVGCPSASRQAALKARMAAFVIALAAEDRACIGHGIAPPTARDLRDLFDAIAQDSPGEQQRDTDLPEGDDAWRKAVERAGAEVRPFVRAALAFPGWTKLAR